MSSCNGCPITGTRRACPPSCSSTTRPCSRNDSDEYGRDDFGGSEAAWIAAIDAHTQLFELLNGPSTARDSGNRAAEIAEGKYLRYLRLGFHVGPTGDQDNHYATWGSSTHARTGVVASALTKSALTKSALTKSALYEALRSRHVYAIEDVRYDGGVQYIFFKVTQYSEHGPVDRAWTAPVWLEPPGRQSAGTFMENTASFLASKRSSIYHVTAECRDAARIKDANLVTGAAAAPGRRRHVPCPRQ